MHSTDETRITVHVAYALPGQQTILPVTAKRDDTVLDAIRQSGLLEQYPELSQDALKVGIFGQSVTLDSLVQEGARIEIYRPLIIDPKTSRRQRAASAKKHLRRK